MPRCRALRKQQRGLPSLDPHDPGYRRLRYSRYADDILLGFTGPKAEAEEIKRRLGQFLHEDLKLELSETKTLITHASTNAARFLGYEITAQHDNRKQTAGRRSVNGQIRLRVPMDVIRAKCSQYTKRGQPASRTVMMNEEDHAIINRYAAEYRGIVQYYLLAGDVYRLDRLHWVMQTSLLKTLAGKYGSTVTKMAHRYRATIETPARARRRTGTRAPPARSRARDHQHLLESATPARAPAGVSSETHATNPAGSSPSPSPASSPPTAGRSRPGALIPTRCRRRPCRRATPSRRAPRSHRSRSQPPAGGSPTHADSSV